MAGIRNGLMHRSIDVPTLLTGLCEREPFCDKLVADMLLGFPIGKPRG